MPVPLQMKILLTGGTGQLGWELKRTLAPLGEIFAPPRGQLDLARPGEVAATVRGIRPSVIVNAGAFTDVEGAERRERDAFVVNCETPGVLADEARRLGSQFVHFSTDYVFDGEKALPYTEQDTPNPLNAYGRSKLAGERAVIEAYPRTLVLRAGWIYSAHGKNFLTTILRKARAREPLAVVNDQVGAPTWARLIAEATACAIGRGMAGASIPSGVYHLAAGGTASWHEFAQRIIQYCGLDVPLRGISSSEYPSQAVRPRFSQLDCGKIARDLGIRLPHWTAGVAFCLEDMRHDGY